MASARDWRAYRLTLLSDLKARFPVRYAAAVTFVTNHEAQLAGAAQKLDAATNDEWWQWEHFWGMYRLRQFLESNGIDSATSLGGHSIDEIAPGLLEVLWGIVVVP